MKKRLKQCWLRRPRLTKGQKAVRNLVLFALLCVGFWLQQGSPALTSEGALRRMERMMLQSGGETCYSEPGTEFGSQKVFVLGNDYAYTGSTQRSNIFAVRAYVKDGISREATPAPLRVPAETVSGLLWDAELMIPCWDERAHHAELELFVDYYAETYRLVPHYGQQFSYGRGELLDSGYYETNYYSGTDTHDGLGYYQFSVTAGSSDLAAVTEVMWNGGYTVYNSGEEQHQILLKEVRYVLRYFDTNDALLETVSGELDWR